MERSTCYSTSTDARSPVRSVLLFLVMPGAPFVASLPLVVTCYILLLPLAKSLQSRCDPGTAATYSEDVVEVGYQGKRRKHNCFRSKRVDRLAGTGRVFFCVLPLGFSADCGYRVCDMLFHRKKDHLVA